MLLRMIILSRKLRRTKINFKNTKYIWAHCTVSYILRSEVLKGIKRREEECSKRREEECSKRREEECSKRRRVN